MSEKTLNILLTVAGFVIIWLLFDKVKNKKQIEELLLKIQGHKYLNDEIKSKLSDLMVNTNDIDPKIKSEIGQILGMMEINQDVKGLLSLAKIIENLMKKLYKDDVEFKQFVKNKNIKKPNFQEYLDFALMKNALGKDDYHLVSVLKSIRNEEAHELDVQKDKFKIIIAFTAGISFIVSLYKLIRLKLVIETN